MGLALLATGSCLAQGAPALSACVVLAGTADGFDKETAVRRAQLALGRLYQAVQGREPSRRGHRQRHARRTAALLARQGKREHDVPP